ncbi:MAG: helix-turn-helix domain-containing protein [Desulfurococcus sp.]|nr:helix-turn-helix domain-containing protein [Desulfurococcus sp.]
MSVSSHVEVISEEVSRTLRKAGFRVEVLSYPSYTRSIDIVACRGETRVILKIVGDAGKISSMEVKDLKRSSIVYNSGVAVIAESEHKRKLEDDVVYVRHGINVVSPESFNRYIVSNEKPLIVNIKGNYYLKISPQRLQEKRREIGLRRGELAELIGVSRKAVYMYERGELMISLQKGLELAQLVGEDVFEEIDPLKINVDAVEDDNTVRESELVDSLEKTLWSSLNRLSSLVVKLHRTPVDFVAKSRRVITITRLDRAEKKPEKLENAEKIADTTGSKLIAIKSASDLKNIEEILLDEQT